MIRKLLLVGGWFAFTFVFLLLNLAVLSYMTAWDSPDFPLSAVPQEHSIAATEGTSEVLSATVTAGDARTLLLELFLRQHASPMAPYAALIVAQADKYDYDYRLLPAIAMCESNLGKRVPLKAGFNPFGIAVYTGSLNGKNFDSWEDAIIWASTYLYDRYISQGRTTLEQIGEIWAPPSVENGHSWANCVQFFTDEIV